MYTMCELCTEVSLECISLVPRPLSEKSRKGMVTQPYSALSQGIQSVTQPHANVYICSQNWRCSQFHGLHDLQILIMSVFFNEAIASPMSEDCCHDTSVSNIYIAAWQEIVKLAKVIQLCIYVLLSVQLLAMQNGQIGQGLCVKHVSHPSSHTCSSEKLFLAISMLWKYKLWSIFGIMKLGSTKPKALGWISVYCKVQQYWKRLMELSERERVCISICMCR